MRWSAALAVCLACFPSVGAAAAPATEVDGVAILQSRFVDDWRRFKHHYVSDDGRVVDTGNGNVSHSEGQGYGMLFAVAAGDRETFDQILTWTRNTLQRDDGLHYWRFDPVNLPHIADANSAADGELLIAWALLRASRLWQESTYLVQARLILQSFESRLVRRIGSRLVIIPWDLADLDSPRVINLSYFVFPAMQDIAVETDSKLWVELYEDALDLLEDARFGAWNLPPDWLAIDDDNELTIWSERNPYFGYDAIRVPLQLAWAGHDTAEFLGPFVDAWSRFPDRRAPEWFDLTHERAHARGAGPLGFQAVRTVTESLYTTATTGIANHTDLPTLYAARDYYSASLILLARLAEIEWWQQRR